MADAPEKSIFIEPDPAVEAALAAKLDPEARVILEGADTGALETLVFGRIQSTPFDLRFFVPLFRTFVRNKRQEAAELFFELLLEEYHARAAATEETALLRALAAVWPENAAIRKMLLDRLRALYSGSPSFDALVRQCAVLDAPEPVTAFRALESWLRYDVGRIVYLASRGSGRVREINPSLDAVRVVFQGSDASLSFKLDEALHMLEPLPAGHFLRDRIEKEGELRRLALEDSGELLRRLFASVKRSLSVNELRGLLAGIVEQSAWASWWSAARKDRRLVIGPDNSCAWNDSENDADAAVLRRFQGSPIREKITLARTYGKRAPALASAMARELVQAAGKAREENPALALEILLSLDRTGATDLPDVKSAAEELLNHVECVQRIRAVADRSAHKKAIALLRECRPDWPALYAALIENEDDAQSIGMLYDALRENAGPLLEEAIGRAMSSPAKAPDFFIWLCREMTGRAELQTLADWNFCRTVLLLLSKNALKEHAAALRKLFDDDGAIHLAARRLEAPQAKQLIELLDRDSMLEDYRREKILKDLRAWHPQSQETGPQIFFVSAEMLKLRQAEFHKLTTVDIPKNTEEIIRTRAHGDLRENFEYHAARARQELLSAQAKHLHDELQFARPIDPKKIDASTVCAGTRVRLVPADSSEEITVTVLGPWDSAPERNIVSYLAPAANALLGKRVGEPAVFNGKSFSIAEITGVL